MERIKINDFPRHETDGGEVAERIGKLERCAAELVQTARSVVEADSVNGDLITRLRKYLLEIDSAYIDATVTVLGSPSGDDASPASCELP